MKQAKLTAANSTFLADVKKTWNAPIFREVSRLLNDDGLDAAKAYIAKHRGPAVRDQRSDVRQSVKDLLDLHFAATNSTKTPDERCEASMGFCHQLEDVRELLEVLDRSVDAEFPGGH